MRSKIFSLLGLLGLCGASMCAAWAQAPARAIGADIATLQPSPESKRQPPDEATSGEDTNNVIIPLPAAVSSANYVFATATNESLTDMSSGTTQLVGAAQDDTASAITNIGFEFFMLGTRYTQFSVNSNGAMRLGGTAVSTTQYTLGTAGVPLVACLVSDNFTSTTGKIHYKTTGAAPNRVLNVEFLRTTIIYDGGGATADGTCQIRLHETSGLIELVYGAMNRNNSTGFGGGLDAQHMGFSINSTAGNIASIDTNNAESTAGPTPNQFPLNAPMASLTSALDGTRRVYTFTPPVPTAPTAINFTGVGPLAMTVNWTDSPDEQLYSVYRSTDGVNFTFQGTLAQNSTSFNAVGLNPNTTYFWQVYAVSDGALSAVLAGSQTTGAGGSVTSTAAGGNWSNPATWSGGVVPVATDNVTIADSATVTIDTAAVALSVNVGTSAGSAAVLTYDSTAARSLVVGTFVTVNGTLNTPAAGAVTTHALSVGGDLTNNGVLDLSTNGNTAGAALTFTGTNNNTFGGNGITTDVRTITVAKGASANVIELSTSNFTVQGVATDVAGYLTVTSGTFKLSGTFGGTNRVFGVAAYAIPAAGGFWLNNPNYVVAGQNGSPTVTGVFHVSQGTYNIGTATGNSMGFATGATVVVDGGAINATGRFGVAAAANVISYTQTAGTITVCTIGNVSTTLASFDVGTSVNSSISISGGTIIVQLANTAASGPRDYRDQAGSGIAGVTGGTLQLGNAASGAAKLFTLRGEAPNLVVTNTSAAHSAQFDTTLVSYNNASRNLTLAAGTTLNCNNALFLFEGSLISNDGTLRHNGASSVFFVINSTAPVLYTGAGSVLAPMTVLAAQADLNFTVDAASSGITTGDLVLFTGNIINANKITIGNGGATTAIVQIGNTTTPSAAGTLDSAPVFNPGTGGSTIFYLRTTLPRTMGFEANPAHVFTNFQYDDPDPTHALTQTGGDVTVNATATMANGRIVTGASNFIIGPAGTVARTTGYVDGNLRKNFAAAANKTFEVGSANGFSPVAFNATAGTFPADVTIAAVQSTAPGIQPLSDVISRYWNVSASGVTADMTFSYLLLDIPGTVTEANMHVLHQGAANPNDYSDAGGTINTGTHTALVTGVSSFSAWTLGTAEADLAITKDDGVLAVTAGGNTTYTITVTNGGTVGNPAALVTDTFPAELTCSTTCSGAGGGTCTAGPFAGNISDSANIPSGGSVTYVAACAISPTATVSISNTATVAGGAVADNNAANNSATDTDAVGAIADLSISKDDGVTTATPGGSVTYTITAGNAGPSVATGATVADTFPAALTCTWTCSGSGGTCTASGAGNINDTVNLTSGGSVTYTASCSISAAATGILSNTAVVTAPGSVIDSNPNNNSATDTDTLAPSVDLSVTKTDGVTSATAGGSVTYTITSSNAGPSNAPGSTVADTFPASLTCTWTCTGAGGGTCTGSGSGNINDTVNLPAGGSVTHVASCTIASSATGTLSNTATVSGGAGTTDPNPGNNSATDSDTLDLSSDLAITKTDGVASAAPGGTVTYTITASNSAGPSDTTGATVADTFPATETCTWTCNGAGGGTCTASGSGNISDTVNLQKGGSVTYTASCTISASATGTVSNTATVAVPASVTDPVPGNNSATDTDTLSPSADLAITKTDGVTSATPGGSVTYTITASNAGPSDATGAGVADTFPASETCTWTCVSAGGASCTASGAGNINDTVNLPSGGSSTYTASCSIISSATGTLSNTATVTAPGSVSDPTPGNNSATDSDTLVPSTSLTVTVDDGHAYVRYGQLRNYLLKISNGGPSDATDIGISETLSADFVAGATQWDCFGGEAGASCTASGTGPLSDSNVAIPASRSLTWLVSVPVRTDAPEGSADNAFDVSTAQDANAPYSVTDSDLVVIFRDGFDVAFADGSGEAPALIELNALAHPLSAGQTLAFTLPASTGSHPVDMLVHARAADGTGFRVERLNLGAAPSVRLVAIDVLGGEHAGKWTPSENGGHVLLGLIAGTGTDAALETSAGESTLQLSAQVQEVYQVDAAGAASVSQ